MKLDQNSLKMIFILLILSSSIAYMASVGLKDALQIQRPCAGSAGCEISYSFPSSHATMAFAAAITLSLYIRRRDVTALLFVASILVGVWRVMTGLHTVYDVVGGAVVGMAIGVLIYVFFKKYHGSRARRK